MLNKKTLDFYKKYIASNPKLMELEVYPLENIKASGKYKFSTKYGRVKIYLQSIYDGFSPSIKSAENKHEYFLNILKERNPDILKDIKFLSEYNGTNENLICRTKYGNIKVNPSNLFTIKSISIIHAVDKKEYFSNRLKDLNPKIAKEVEIVEYKNTPQKCVFKHKYGLLECESTRTLKIKEITITQAIDKNEFFFNQLKDLNPDFLKNNLPISYYEDHSKKIYFVNENGVFGIIPQGIITSKVISPSSYVNYKNYFLIRAKQIHGNNYDYSLIDSEVSSKSKSKIICKKHGIFEKRLKYHITDSCTGCQKCSKENLKGSYGAKRGLEKNKQYYKNTQGLLYLLKIEVKDTKEVFYKVGITKRTIAKRFSDINTRCKITILKKENNNLYSLAKKEQEILKQLKEFKYIPNIKFGGYTECFNVNPLDHITYE